MKIGIVGCGWLGLPLAEKLAQQHQVIGTTTTRKKLPKIEEKGIQPAYFKLSIDDVALPEALKSVSVLIITLPPHRQSSNSGDEYSTQIENLLSAFSRHGFLRHIIFTSSTGIYPNHNHLATEEMVTPGEVAHAEKLRATSRAIRKGEGVVANSGRPHTILRLAGLYGPNREPGRFFAGRKDVAGPAVPVNMVHRDDVVQIVIKVIEALENDSGRVINEIFNVCADHHPTRSEFYTRAAESIGAKPPTFNASEAISYKTVANQKVKEMFDYTFIHGDPMADVADVA